MIQIPAHFISQYIKFIAERGVQPCRAQYYVKWLRYYLDFCQKYSFRQDAGESVAPFLEKMKEKKQADKQRAQAHHAISLYCDMLQQSGGEASKNLAQRAATTQHQSSCEPLSSTSVPQTLLYQGDPSQGAESRQDVVFVSCIEESPKLSGADWTGVFNELTSVIKISHYSPAKLRTYAGRTRKLQAFTKRKDKRLGGGHAQQRPVVIKRILRRELLWRL